MNDVVRSLENDFNGSAPSPSPAPTAPQVKGVTVDLPVEKGDKGQFVKEIQQDLIKAGVPLPRYGADGIFGDETEKGVRTFQQRHGLLVDGLVGPQTLSKLEEVLESNQTTSGLNLPNGILRRGDRGDNVREVQRALDRVNFDPGPIDGIYGPKTEDAVRRFQSMYAALADDGIYGPNTKRYLERELSN
ncbi:peptidoglycan-binding domain-containing protein [Litchfieldia alkalitelluris]|uniref:peptidoglycan-binding domain-containing protein n=1 Tax=Litchfieldia alkalitelluris TaxID=304268 RepID=UPI0022876A32|nr:peptidoglycan-binding protein [Litchfieldia alkalitelluris]